MYEKRTMTEDAKESYAVWREKRRAKIGGA